MTEHRYEALVVTRIRNDGSETTAIIDMKLLALSADPEAMIKDELDRLEEASGTPSPKPRRGTRGTRLTVAEVASR